LSEKLVADPKDIELTVHYKVEIITPLLIYKQPGFLGEQYPFSIKLTRAETYEVKSLVIAFCEVDNNPKSLVIQPVKVRKASIRSVDSDDIPSWSYLLYISNPENGLVEKLEDYQYTLIEVKDQVLNFFMKFREEGNKSFEVIFRYTACRQLTNNTLTPEFTLEHKEYFNVQVLCPFILKTEWIIPDPNTSCNNAYFNKTHLGINKKAILNTKISTGSFPKVEIHNVSLKTKGDFVNDCTKELTHWKKWPITLSEYESLSLSFIIVALRKFENQQMADIDVLWNRSGKNENKSICSIPLPHITANDSSIDVTLTSVPPIAKRFKELFTDYIIRNTTNAMIEIKVKIEESLHFFLAGEIETRIILPPYETEAIKFGLVPLRCGKFDLPSICVSMVAVSEPIINSNFKHSIYVFPN